MPEPADNADQPELNDPPADVWARLGLAPEGEIHGGYQSRVFRAIGEMGRLVVKLTEAAHDDGVMRQRVEFTHRLAEVNPTVVGPVVMGSDLVTEVDAWRAVCYPYVEGGIPDVGDRHDAEAMASTLAALHGSLATLTGAELPPVAALHDANDDQLQQGRIIHGDYAAANLIVTPTGLRIIDFDDCGEGSYEFEIGNSLYMVLFDSWHTGNPDRYQRFRSWFINGYRSTASIPIDEQLLNRSIEVRTEALGRWLANPAKAPVGIQTASAEWRRRLRSFLGGPADDVRP